ncbi:hypothetical protein PVE_R1G1975 [Pseudomonas veronii 1YdBTEX2]|uniref:Arc-like DNA binding domain-containing protein n=1 Tax=Pseudomonas veronii 1YdBTEX2 TaxID=1295141 RepID=A0A1D3JV90_PSEVE|nr:Arc family DNA-binding protein [Pseudomonas veronii]SBW79861.1 hypothetical protein PVE_R1G1975 [Pseudomonas veronii 1YdBTEX2]
MNTQYDSRTADKFVVRLPDGLRNEVQGAADHLDTSMNTVFVQAVRQYLDNQKRQQLLLDALAKAVTGKEELDAVLHWRSKHTQAIRERDALQALLTAADERADKNATLAVGLAAEKHAAGERADVLEGLLRRSMLAMSRIYEAGRDFIVGSGSDCDSVELMMENDPTAREIRAALNPAEPATDDHICAGCGAKGWTANCKECVPY